MGYATDTGISLSLNSHQRWNEIFGASIDEISQQAATARKFMHIGCRDQFCTSPCFPSLSPSRKLRWVLVAWKIRAPQYACHSLPTVQQTLQQKRDWACVGGG